MTDHNPPQPIFYATRVLLRLEVAFPFTIFSDIPFWVQSLCVFFTVFSNLFFEDNILRNPRSFLLRPTLTQNLLNWVWYTICLATYKAIDIVTSDATLESEHVYALLILFSSGVLVTSLFRVVVRQVDFFFGAHK